MQSSEQLRVKIALNKQEKVVVLSSTQRHPFMKTEVDRKQLKEHKTNYFGKLRSIVGTKRPTSGVLRRAIV